MVDDQLAALKQEFNAIDMAARETMRSLDDVVFVATHPRYQYFARAYGLNVLSPEWETAEMPNADQLADLEALVENEGASVLNWEAEPPEEARHR